MRMDSILGDLTLGSDHIEGMISSFVSYASVGNILSPSEVASLRG